MSTQHADDDLDDEVLDELDPELPEESLSMDERKARQLDLRRKIEERMEEQRLRREIGDWDDWDDWDDE